MSEECYNLEFLQKYQNNSFIYVRKSINEENIFSYKIIIEETKKLIQCLEKYQIENNSGVAIDLKEHSPASCVLILGILNLKCNFFCLDLNECKDVDNYLRLSGVKYVISSLRFIKPKILKNQSEQIIIFNEIYFLTTIMPTTSILKNVNLCYTIATSGSTGEPKMVYVPYDCILPNIKSLSSLLNVQSRDLIFLGSPPTFDPFVVEFFLALMNGTGLLITSNQIRLQPKNLHQIIFPENNYFTKGVTIYQTTPSLFRLFGAKTIGNILNKNTSLRCLILGGEEFPSLYELETWIPTDFQNFDKRIFNIYGITEISCWSSICEFIPSEYLNKIRNVSVGKPLDDYTHFRIRDKTGNVLLKKACKGELEIGSSIRCCFIPEYDKDEKILKSQEIIYRKTGDLVVRDELDNIYYLGRTNNTFKRMGKRINLDTLNKKIENLISKGIFIKVAALWLKDSMKLIFYLVNANGFKMEQKQFIQSILQHNLESHKHPDEIVYSIKPLPLTKNGKVDHFKILEEISKNKSCMAPSTIFKDFLINIMGLNMDTPDNTSTQDKKRMKMSDISFTKAGGTSLQALSLSSEITEKLGNAEDQRKILEMLLDSEVSVSEILTYIEISEKKRSTCLPNLPNKNLSKLKFTFKFMWRCDLEKCVDASPTAYKDVIAVGSHSHLLLVVDSKTGKEISRIELPDRIECPVVFVTSDLATVGCYDGFLYGFNYRMGSITWNINVKGMIKAKPLVTKNLVIVASYAEKYNVVAYDLKSAALKWYIKFGTKGIFSSPLLISEELMLLCNLDGSYGLVEIKSSLVKWQKKLDSPIFATAAKVVTSEEILLVLAEVKGQVTICQAKDGVKVASYQTKGNIFSGINVCKRSYDDYFIIFGCYDKNVYCLNFNMTTRNLTVIWKYLMNDPIFSTPITISNDYVFCCSTKGMIALLDVGSAELKASYDIKAEIFSTPNCLNNSFIYLGSRDNFLYAFEVL